MIYPLFFLSGVSALVYEVVWVRVFANVFGNTIYSASIVTAVFMLGLGAGSFAFGILADRRPAMSMVRAFAFLEGGIGVLGLAVSLALPHLGDLSAAVSSYTRGADGWYVLSFASYAARTAIAIVLLTPITLLMGATLTALIRHAGEIPDSKFQAPHSKRVGWSLDLGPWNVELSQSIALLYGANTLGAALGCVLTDYALVPSFGLSATQMVAVALNFVTAAGALQIKLQVPSSKIQAPNKRRIPNPERRIPVTAAAAALVLTGAAGMGMEILWFRDFSILLGEFRAVFALLLAVILLGMGIGSLLGAFVLSGAGRIRPAANPARILTAVQALFVMATLIGLAAADARSIERAATPGGLPTPLADLWFNARPIFVVVGLPAVLMGFAFPIANAMIQRVQHSMGRRAGLLYLANTFGAVCGSIVTGFVLLPVLGMQRSATVLMMAAAAAMIPIGGRKALAIPIVSIAAWVLLPSDFLLSRALLFPPQRAYALSEGVTELVAVTDGPDGGRVLVTNGHPMSSTELLSQRYMRAMAHIPLLMIDRPERVLVLCFGVGNTAHAATLHPTVKRVDVVDLSRHILEHADYFKAFNGDVLHDPRVNVYINDGRHHLQMGARAGVNTGSYTAQYDLITLEPPPIVHAGVAALYTTEFYARARARLTPNGYLTQWLPAYGVPQSMILSMVRSFVDVFPNAVLLSGASSNLLLVGTTAARNEIDPNRIAAALRNAPAVQMDLQHLDLGTPRDIVGMFVASSNTLRTATRDADPVTDDRPMQEYGRRSLLPWNEPIPPSLIAVDGVASWCPACNIDGLDTYLSILKLALTAPPLGPAQTVASDASHPIAGSGYLGAVVPQSPELHAILRSAFVEAYQRGTDQLAARRYNEAIESLRAALTWNPDSAEAHNNLGIALASTGRMDEAVQEFRHALAVDPEFDDARRNLGMASRKAVIQ